MTLAAQAIAAPKRGSFAKRASHFGGTLYDRVEEGFGESDLLFYVFPDGSKVGTKGRGRNWQVWEVKS